MTTLPAPETPEWQKPQMFYGKPLEYYPASHRYKWDGQWVPSVTTILNRLNKPMLIQWAADMAVEHVQKKISEWPEGFRYSYGTLLNICQEARLAHANIRDAAGDVGTLVHKYAKDMLEGKGLPTGPEAKPVPIQAANAIAAFREWLLAHKIEPIAVERRVMSRELMYSGTCDFFGHIDGKLSVLDFKTGNGVYDEAWFQMAGYEIALREELQEGSLASQMMPMQHWLVHLNKNTGECAPYLRTSEETIAAKAVWRNLVAMDRAIRDMPKMPKVKKAA